MQYRADEKIRFFSSLLGRSLSRELSASTALQGAALSLLHAWMA
jgi:hypothetical protein